MKYTTFLSLCGDFLIDPLLAQENKNIINVLKADKDEKDEKKRKSNLRKLKNILRKEF
tara:strand:- start:1542 stop:1715 length:174 start_codon:yes stop_codon:yes gene_type:complete